MKTQYIKIDECGDKFYYSDAAMKISHREDGPAVEYANGHKEWWVNGKIHRTDGPAIEYAHGNKAWYVNGYLHRTDGPAVEYADGHKEWYVNGKIHRTDGPAIEYANGHKEWWIDDVELTEAQFNTRINRAEEELRDIALLLSCVRIQ